MSACLTTTTLATIKCHVTKQALKGNEEFRFYIIYQIPHFGIISQAPL